MAIHLHALQTWNPDTVYVQSEASELMQNQFEDSRTKRVIRHIYKHSEIAQRHTAVKDFGSADSEELFADQGDGKWKNPLTGDRNKFYMEISRQASVDLARETLQAAPGFEASDITHIVTASCTGFYNPGPDYHIIKELGLSQTVERFHLGFMGCYAAFPALRLADSLCRNDPNAVVLIQCLELCSLHVQLDGENPETVVAGSLFADGAGCALVSARPPAQGQCGYELKALNSALTSSGGGSMAWEIGNHGYEIVLSSYVPHILGENIRKSILPGLEKQNWDISDVDFWCVHPGGKAILDRITEALELPQDSMDTARDILRNYGNMSSATIFFLLRKGLQEMENGSRTAAMAFGPGLTVEMAFMERKVF
ncbi:MAG: type III polyketide synthase [Kiritimatiellia bacterium]